MDNHEELIERIKVLQQQLDDARAALREMSDLNPLHNDFDAYQYHLCGWGLGESERPKPENYGLKSK